MIRCGDPLTGAAERRTTTSGVGLLPSQSKLAKELPAIEKGKLVLLNQNSVLCVLRAVGWLHCARHMRRTLYGLPSRFNPALSVEVGYPEYACSLRGPICLWKSVLQVDPSSVQCCTLLWVHAGAGPRAVAVAVKLW